MASYYEAGYAETGDEFVVSPPFCKNAPPPTFAAQLASMPPPSTKPPNM